MTSRLFAALAVAVLLASCAAAPSMTAASPASQSAQTSSSMSGDNRLTGPNGNTDVFGGAGQ